MKQDDPQFKFRMPLDLKARLDAEATKNTRTLGAEIVARLAASFDQTPSANVQALEAELDQQRALAEQFRAIADSNSAFMSLLAMHQLHNLQKLIENGLDNDIDARIEESFIRWIGEKDPRGAAFTILRLIDHSTPEIVETLRNFASQLEGLDLVRHPIVLTPRTPGSKKPAQKSVPNKVILLPKMPDDLVRIAVERPAPSRPIKRGSGKPPKTLK